MTRASALAVCAVMLSGCGENPTAPTGSGPVTLRAVISAASEVPPIAGPEAAARGTATLTINPTRDADGIITGGTLDTTIALSGLSPNTVLTAAQVQVGGAAANGVIVQETGLAAQGGAALPTGEGTVTIRGVAISALVANALVSNPVAYYLNVRSALNAGGVARGQLLFP